MANMIEKKEIGFKSVEPAKLVKRGDLFLSICRLLVILCCISVWQLSAQSYNINLNLKNVSLHRILLEIKNQSGNNFVYNNNLIEKYQNESIELKNETLDNSLKKILVGKELKYNIIDNVIIIEPQNKILNETREQVFYQTLKGIVVDAQTETPLIGATIALMQVNPPIGTTTDINGYYKIEKVPIGRQTIIVSYVGYRKKRFDNIMILSAKENVLNVKLEESIEKLSDIEITAYSKTETISKIAAVSARSFTTEETEKFAGSLGDPSRMATNYAGVFTVGDQRNDIVIRGNSPMGLLWRVEGLPVPSPNHFDVQGTTGGPISMLNNNLMAQSDFFTGAFPAEFGNAYSGVFDIRLRNGNSEKSEYLAQLGFNGIELGAEGPITLFHKASYIINARYSILGLVKDLLWVEGLPEYKDISFKLNFPLQSGKFSLFGIGGISSISMHEDNEEANNTINKYGVKSDNGSKTGILGISLYNILNSETYLSTGFAISSHGPDETADSTINEIPHIRLEDNHYQQNEISLTSVFSRKLGLRNIFSVGFVLQNMSFKADRMTSDDDSLMIIDVPYSLSKNNLMLSQIFVEWKHSFSDVLSINAGVNTLFFHYNKTSAIDPRIGVSWQLSENQSMGLGYGLHSQIQPLNVYFIHSKVGFDINGRQIYSDLGTNKDLGFTKSNHFVVSYNHTLGSNLRLKTETYYQFLYNVPVKSTKGYYSIINSGAAMSVPEEDSLVNSGNGENYGIEITLEKFLSQNYYFLVTASFFNSLYKGHDKVWRNTTYNGKYILNMLGGVEFNIKENVMMNINVRSLFAGGRRITPYDYERSIKENRNYYLYDQAYEKQVKDYMRIDFRIGLLFQGSSVTHELAIDIINITNNKNVYREKYDSNTKKTKTEYQQGIFPMGLYRLYF